MILKNIKNFLPYFLLIGIYFFFINIEIRKDGNKIIQKDFEMSDDQLIFDNQIKIPVIPYKQ